MDQISIHQLNAATPEEFVARLGSVFEHSSWVAELTLGERPFQNLKELHSAMVHAVEESGKLRQLELIRAHPDLVGKLAREGRLAAESTSEQQAAGLDRLSPEEIQLFDDFNRQYWEKFGFPFVICARLNRKESILEAFPVRLGNSPEQERETALSEIAKIALLRLRDILRSGRLTTHVLDTARGCPADGVPVKFSRLETGEVLGSATTNADGRVAAALWEGDAFCAGWYQLSFEVGEYFGRAKTFFGTIPIQFQIIDASEHYHVPLLVSPYGYSTYRGS